MPDNRYLKLLNRAMRSRHGIKIQSDDTAELRKRLYTEVQKNGAYAVLSLRISPTDPDTLWIVRHPDEAQAETVPAPKQEPTP